MGTAFRGVRRQGKDEQFGLLARSGRGYTIIEVMLFFAVTGGLMLGVLGSASLGVNTQRYNDAVNTFTAIVQEEFTNVTNVMNTKSVENMCGLGDDSELTRGISDCVIIGRLMTIDDQGGIVRSNLVGRDPGTEDANNTELQVMQSYAPKIDISSQVSDSMSWGTKLEKGNPPTAVFTSILFLRSPRSGNVYTYVNHSTSGVITTDAQLSAQLATLIGETTPRNSADQYMCIDRSGWVLTPVRVVKLAPFSSGPSGVAIADAEGTVCE